MNTETPQGELARLLEGCRHVLLDFDGPVCSIFAGVGAPSIAAQLRDLLAEHTSVPEELVQVDDPLEILRSTPRLSSELAERLEGALRAAEVRAASSATPAPGAEDFITATRSSGRTLSIVSNNSQAGVEAYLARRGLAASVDLVVGRSEADPSLMKPNPHLLLRAMDLLGAEPDECVLVGDSISDVQSGVAAGVRTVGFANKPGKAEQLVRAGVGGIVVSMADLARAALASPTDAIRR